ncbi:MAG: efflux RND transporter periplasmic adaptor subunit [Desulfobacter sp.]|nr:efflux RND transporter periplasmic adaptor subunit [Desulfobacter sp.]
MRSPNGFVLILFSVFLSGIAAMGCDRQQAFSPPPPVPEVAFIRIEPQPLMLTTELPGRTSAWEVAQIRPQVSGLVQERLFTEGANVKKGQALYQIDPAPFQAALDNARANHLASQRTADRERAALQASIADLARLEANLDLALKNRERYETLFEKKVVSTIQRDQFVTEAKAAAAAFSAAQAQVESRRGAVAAALAGIQQAEAMMKTARINLSYTRIIAPISGRIGMSAVTRGAMVTAYQAQALAIIQQMDPIYVDVPQSTTQLLRLRKRLEQGRISQDGSGQNKVGLILEDGTAYPVQGVLEFQDITVDPTTGSVILRVVFSNSDNLLLPGMFVRVSVKEGTHDRAVLIPQQSVSRDPKGNPVIFTLDDDNKVRAKMLTLDRAIGDQWLVSSGLLRGDRLIVEGIQKVRPGALVRPVPLEPGPVAKEQKKDNPLEKSVDGGQ